MRKSGNAGSWSASSSSSRSKRRSIEAERNRRAEILKAREATFKRILENAPAMFIAAQLRVFLRALVNLDPYTLADDVAEHFAGDNENNQQTAEEILLSAIDDLSDEKLTGFALRLALTSYVGIPREGEFDFLTEAANTFIPLPSGKEKKPKKAVIPVKSSVKRTATKKKIAAKAIRASMTGPHLRGPVPYLLMPLSTSEPQGYGCRLLTKGAILP